MSVFVKNFVEGCVICQSTKNITHPPQIHIQPTETPIRPWQYVTTDFVTDLPEINGLNSINVVVDQFSKMIVISPCRKDITAEETATLFMNNVWKRFGLPEKIISDRGPQFASKVTQSICKALNIRSALSTAFHPQTDGSTERVNQEFEQYLQAFCNGSMTNWPELLPTAEFAHNSKEHSATKKSPFELLMGYQPRFQPRIIPNPLIPTAKQHLLQIEQSHEEAKASLTLAAEEMRKQEDKWGLEKPKLTKGDKVWLDGKNLKLRYPKMKLAPKKQGPFVITEEIGTVNYRLKLPKTWKIHPVFHASLITPYKETIEHGPNYTLPPPEIIEDEQEWEVEDIVDSRLHGRDKQLQYYVKWKGYPDADNSWEPKRNLQNAGDKITEFHKKHPSAPRHIRSLGINESTLAKYLREPLTEIL